MVISQLAAMELAESCERIERPFRQFVAWLRRAGPQPTQMMAAMPGGGELMPGGSSSTGEAEPVEAAAEAGGESEEEAPEPPEQAAAVARRRAEAAALRGIFLAQKCRNDAAECCFVEAVEHDPTFDLTGLPVFWQLSRAGMAAVIHAYQRTGQVRRAAMIEATIRQMLRPRAVRRVGRAAR